jgi:hypothetical protein
MSKYRKVTRWMLNIKDRLPLSNGVKCYISVMICDISIYLVDKNAIISMEF